MQKILNTGILIGIVGLLTYSMPAYSQTMEGSSCENAIHIGTGVTNLSFPKAGTYWFEASTFDLPMDVIFMPSNQESTLEPQAWADFRCDDKEPYADDIAKALGIGTSTYVQMPTKLNLKVINRNGKRGYQFTMDTTYRDMIRTAGITRNVQVFVRVIVQEAGSTDVDPFIILHECLDSTRYLEETDTVHVIANDSVTPFVFPLSQWAKDSVQLIWKGLHSSATVYLGKDDCHFKPDVNDPNYLHSFVISSEGIKKFTDKDIKLLIKQLGSGGLYFGKIVSDESADMIISPVPERAINGVRLTYNVPLSIDAKDTTAYYFNKEWQATHFEVSTTRDVSVYMGLSPAIDPDNSSTYFFTCEMDYDAVNRVHYLDLSNKELSDYGGRQSDDEKFIYMKVLTSNASRLTATEWITSEHANMSYQLRENSPIAFAGNLSVNDRIYRMRYADWKNSSITVTRDGVGNPGVEFVMGITTINDWSGTKLAFPSSSNSLIGSYYKMAKTKKTYTYDVSIVNSWGTPSDADGFYYWVFNSNKKNYNVTFTCEKAMSVTACVKDTSMGVLRDGENHVNEQTFFGELGSTVVLEAEPKEGYSFSHWEDRMTNVLSVDARFEYTIIGNTVVYAIFKPSQATGSEENRVSCTMNGEPKKVLYQGSIYILRDGVLYDVLGKRIE